MESRVAFLEREGKLGFQTEQSEAVFGGKGEERQERGQRDHSTLLGDCSASGISPLPERQGKTHVSADP